MKRNAETIFLCGLKNCLVEYDDDNEIKPTKLDSYLVSCTELENATHQFKCNVINGDNIFDLDVILHDGDKEQFSRYKAKILRYVLQNKVCSRNGKLFDVYIRLQ
ncbi:hypothetical protein [Epinotia aporema granulovirus]|uniref:Uncharacterized protein n=1 Tax=Epinotia aporema granulovirus TaxID=166056 RepID=K4EQ25_9BBAC|nr:hypothetical protein [Epinotia aporema granulovirus]AER41497.1 hypothetical protein [Epinotia aporema granulovirus]